MHEDMNNKISQFLDDELPYEEALNLLQKMRVDSELADKLRRYEAVSHALKNDDLLVAARPDFISSVSRRIQLEPAYLITDVDQRAVRKQHFTRSQKIAAAAASVAVIAFASQMRRPEPATKMLVATSKPSARPASKTETSKTLRDSSPVNRQINDYLQAHSSIYTNGQVESHPYAQVTHYSQK